MGKDINLILIKALEESGDEKIEIVIENELPEISKDMYEWWNQNMVDTRLYKMWHRDHISFEIEKTGDADAPFIGKPTEKIGEYGPSTVRFKGQPRDAYPFVSKYENYRWAIHLSPDGTKVLSTLCSEYEEGPNGLKIRQIFQWPSKTPKALVTALRQHVNEEVENFPEFLPGLYQRETGKSI